MFSCVLKCQFVPKGIHTLIEHTKIWLKNFNDSVLLLTVPILALKVVGRIAISISKESRALWRSVFRRGKCYTKLQEHLRSLTLIIHLWTDAQGSAGWDGVAGRTRFILQVCGRRKHCLGSFQGHRRIISAWSWPWNSFGTWRNEEFQEDKRRTEMRARDKKGAKKRKRKKNGKEGGRGKQAAFLFFSLRVCTWTNTTLLWDGMHYPMLWLFRNSLCSLINKSKQLKSFSQIIHLSFGWTLLWKAVWGTEEFTCRSTLVFLLLSFLASVRAISEDLEPGM